jgi:hypothetical protein
MIPSLAQATWNPALAPSGTFPACKTNTVAPLTAAFPNSSSPSNWQFYACSSGAKYLAITVRKIVLIGTNGATIVALDKMNDTSLQSVDIIASPFDLLKDIDTRTLINGSFTIDKIELTFDHVIQANSLGKIRDERGEVLQCGTTSKVFSGGVANTQASPIGTQGGTTNGKPSFFYQKHGLTNSSAGSFGNTQGRSWIAINTFNLLPPGFATDAYSFYLDESSNTQYDSLYSSAISANLDSNRSSTVKWVSIKAVDSAGNPSGFKTSIGNYSTKYIVNTMQLRTPLRLSSKSKFNIDLNLDLSQMFGWAFYYTTNSGGSISSTPNVAPTAGNGNTPTYTNDCLNLFIGPMLLNVKRSAVKDD